MKIVYLYYMLAAAMLAMGCIKDDFVNDTIDPELRITSSIDTLALGSTFQFESKYLNNIGQEEEVAVAWSSSDNNILQISNNGLVNALSLGTAIIYVEYNASNNILRDSTSVTVAQTTSVQVNEVNGSIKTTSSYLLEGDFSFKENALGVNLQFESNYKASTALPGLYIYLSNNKNSIANALEVAAVRIFSGSHEYQIDNLGFNDYKYIVYFCKPFNVKVGDGEL